MLRHSLAPTLIVMLIVVVGTYFGRIQWSGMHVLFIWFDTGGELGHVESHIIYMPASLVVAFLTSLIVALTVLSRLLLGQSSRSQEN